MPDSIGQDVHTHTHTYTHTHAQRMPNGTDTVHTKHAMYVWEDILQRTMFVGYYNCCHITHVKDFTALRKKCEMSNLAG